MNSPDEKPEDKLVGAEAHWNKQREIEEGITDGMREEADRLAAGLAEQAIRTSQQALLLFAAFEMAIEREQEIYAPGNTPSEDDPNNKVIHETLGAIRSALNQILEDDSNEARS